jgi:hypothetical protein
MAPASSGVQIGVALPKGGWEEAAEPLRRRTNGEHQRRWRLTMRGKRAMLR